MPFTLALADIDEAGPDPVTAPESPAGDGPPACPVCASTEHVLWCAPKSWDEVDFVICSRCGTLRHPTIGRDYVANQPHDPGG